MTPKLLANVRLGWQCFTATKDNIPPCKLIISIPKVFALGLQSQRPLFPNDV
jgi:hypothetical protein